MRESPEIESESDQEIKSNVGGCGRVEEMVNGNAKGKQHGQARNEISLENLGTH